MRLPRLVLREVGFRRVAFLVGALGVAVGVALVLLLVSFTRASEHETRILQRDIGLNVRIVPEATDLADYWLEGFTRETMPAEYLERVSDQEVANRLVPLLARRVAWGGVDVLLTGIGGEVFQAGNAKKPVFGREVEAGTLVIGSAVAAALGVGRGDAGELLGEPFSVARVLAETGSEEDARVYANLADVQRLLDEEGRISEIHAIECHCEEDVADPLVLLRDELEALLPGTRVVRRESAADARREQRLLADKWVAVVAPVVVVLTGAWIGLLAYLNLRERRNELGVLFALGEPASAVGALVVLRSALLGTTGAVAGCALAVGLTRTMAPRLFDAGLRSAALEPGELATAVLAVAILSLFASLVPAALASTRDPAEVLRDR